MDAEERELHCENMRNLNFHRRNNMNENERELYLEDMSNRDLRRRINMNERVRALYLKFFYTQILLLFTLVQT